MTARVDTAPLLALLERARVRLEGEIALGLSFQGSYSRTNAKETAYGGHASGMGPAPAGAPASDDDSGGAPSPVVFEETVRLPTRTFGGGPTKDHILESAGTGVALFDYDGDGLLDIYLVTAAELTPARQRIAHRNALYRNLGDWKFEDVSKKAGVDVAAWGSGVCAGDVDGDGHLDLYVTNWGPNFLFRNRGDGTFEEVAARAGVAAGGWSTGCTFFDADADGDLDLYVARYVDTSWDDLLRATRTLLWRNGPRIMVGPAGLRGEADLFFENLGNGRFVETAEARGLLDAAGAYGFGVVANDWQISGVYRWTSGRPYPINFSIPGINNGQNLTGNDGNPGPRVVLTCDPGKGWSGDPYKQIENPQCFAPAQPGSVGDESARFFLHGPPINNVDLSLSKRFRVRNDIGFEIRLDAFNALNHTQFQGTGANTTGVNNTVNFASLTNNTITNLPHDANGNLVRTNGFGAISGVAAPRTFQLVTRVTF